MLNNLLNRDNKDFAKIYDKYVRSIYNFIYYKTYHKETAEDLTSATFTKALNKFETFDLNKGSISTWLYQIARNTVIDFYRTRKPNVNIEDVWNLSDGEDFTQDFDAKEKIKTVKKYLKALNSEQREIVLLRVWEDKTYREIAKILGKSEPSCRMAYSRAIQTLVAFVETKTY
jgi:RNA polymerase sigma-70 factor, ECF subfamily